MPPRAHRAAWLAAAAVAAGALIGYVVNRAVGMPNATGDIGNWTEPLGLASLFVEAAVIVVGLAGFAVSRRVATFANGLRATTRRRDLAAA